MLISPDYIFQFNDDLKNTNELQCVKVQFCSEEVHGVFFQSAFLELVQ